MNLRSISLLLFLSCTGIAFAQPPKSLHATRILKAPRIDGILNEEIWKEAPDADNFIVGQPKFGDTASKRTVVKVVYDDEAVYIGAHLYDEHSLIRKQLTARDNEQGQDVDLLGVV